MSRMSRMSGCHNRYAYTSEADDCSAHHSTSIFYFISTIAAMVVLGSITLLFCCCVYYKRRRIAEQLRNARNRGHHNSTRSTEPVMYVWSGPVDEAAGPTSEATHTATLADTSYNISKAVGAGREPVSCVIMAGDERPTHLARPLPTENPLHCRLDSKVDEMERGKRRQAS